MTVGEVAKLTGLSVKTVRYYEEIGLVVPDRASNDYRRYSEHHIQTLSFIQKSRSLGFSIEDCRSLVSLYENKSRQSADVKKIAETHLKSVEKKIQELQSIYASLNNLIQDCQGNHLPDCPILDRLAGKTFKE